MAQDLIEKIRAAAQAKGVDPEVAVGIARAESGLDPNAKAKSSSASGLFQILKSTWAGNKGTPGKQFDSDENIRVGTDIISKNVQSLKGYLGRDPSPKEVYAAHYFGATGAQKFLSAAPDTPAKQLFSEKVLAANPNLQGKTAAQILAQLEGKLKIPKSNVSRETTAVAAAPKKAAPKPVVVAAARPGVAGTTTKKPAPVAAPAAAPVTVASMDSRLADLGPSYQAALALSFLADTDEKEDRDIDREPGVAEKYLAEMNAAPRPAALSEFIDVKIRSPFAEAEQPEQPLGMAEGGEASSTDEFIAIKRANGSPETGERMTPQQIEQLAADQVALNTYYPPKARPSTGMNRNITYQSGEDIGALLQGTSELPYDLVGAFRDIPNMIMKPFGYGVDKPVMGSEWLKEQALQVGIRKAPPTNPALKVFHTVGELGAGFINPAGVVRKGVQAAEATTAGVKKAADLLRDLKKPKEVSQTVPTPAPMAGPTPEVLTELARMNEQRQLPRNAAQAPDPLMGVRPTLEEAQANVAARQAEQLPPPPAEVVVPPEMLEMPPVAPPMQATAESVVRPFTGRLDSFVETIKNPVQLGQLKGQLKGKFRDYDLERVERAFAGMDDKTKLTPDQIKQALAGVYSPSRMIAETIPPTFGKHWQNADNVWGAPLGTTNLYLEQTPEALAANALFDKSIKAFSPFLQKTTSSVPTLESLTQARALLSEPEILKIVDPELISNLSTSFDRVEKNIGLIDEYSKIIKNIAYGFSNPVLYVDKAVASAKHLHQPFFKFRDEAIAAEREILKQKFMAQGSEESAARSLASKEFSENFDLYHEKTDRIASQKVQELAIAEAQKHGIDLPDVSLIKWDELSNVTHPMEGNPAFKMSLENAMEPSILTVHQATKNIKTFMDPEIKKVGDILYQRGNLYKGKHPGVAAKPYPISFTRFSEHEATIPGLGTVQGRHFHELQSDLYNAVTKEGSVYGNRAKDQEELARLNAQLAKNRSDAFDQKLALQTQSQAQLPGNNISAGDYVKQMKEIDKKLQSLNSGLEDRVAIVSGRINKKASYNMQEPFANFETSQDIRRQMLIKGAVHSAMRDGKTFATFPGKESAQPQLYVDMETGRSKVYPNLKQVVKDLGGEKMGFDVREIQLPPDKDGNPITAWGITWSPESAARIAEKGIPFAKGGMVEGYAKGGIADLPKGYDEEDATTLKPFLPTTTPTANNAGIATIVPGYGNPNAAAAQAASFAKLTPVQLAQHQVQLAMISDAKPMVVQLALALKDAVQNAINNSTATSSGGVSTSSGSPMGGIASKGTVAQANAAVAAANAAAANAAAAGGGSSGGTSAGNGSGASSAGGSSPGSAYSDVRMKDNIKPIGNALSKVKKLDGITFDMEGKRGAGLAAQQVEKVLPEVVHKDAKGMRKVDYGKTVGLLVEAVKELDAKKKAGGGMIERQFTDNRRYM